MPIVKNCPPHSTSIGIYMKTDQDKPKKELINELRELRYLLKDAEASVNALNLAKSEVQRARIYAENIIETMREPLLVLDADLKILSANRSFYATFEVKPGETLGSYIYDLGNRQWDIPRLRLLLENILPQNTHFDDFEVEHDFPSIGHKIMILNARQIYRKEIGRRMILLAIEDITGLRKLEREKRNILSMFAHDMKNPLVTSEGFLSRIISGKAGALTEKQLDYLKIALSELGKVSRLISAFLEFSRFEAREYKPVFAPIDMLAEIRKNIEAEKVETENKQITISLEPPNTATSVVNADAAMIHRVLRNLLDNAIKHTDSGGVVTVSVTDRDNEILVSVKDTGTGIPQDHLPYIFDAFYRIGRGAKGSGLGLAIARIIVELHGGKIWVQSTSSEGSTFKFTLLKR
jgi:PAS domain S-box-containing protein